MNNRKKYEKIIKKVVFGLLSFVITLTSIQLSVASSFYAAQETTGPYADMDVTETVTEEVAEAKHEPGKTVEAPVEAESKETATEATQEIEPLPTETPTIYDEILKEGYHEDISERTPKTKTFVKGTKSETFIFMSDVHFETADGTLEEYDLTLEKEVPTARMFAAASEDAVFEPKQTNLPIKIPEKISPETPLKIESVYGEMTLAPTAAIEDPEVKGQVARYTATQNQVTDIVTLDSGVKMVETFAQTLPEQITYEKTVPQGYEIKTVADDLGIVVVEKTTNRVVETINVPRVSDANNQDLSGSFRIKAEENQGMGTYAITVYQLGEVTPLPQVIPSFPIQLEVSDILLNQAQVVIYGINLYNGSQTYGPGKGNAFGDMFMLGFNNDPYYYPTGLYRGLVNTVVDDWHGLIGDNRTITDAKFGLLEFTASSTSFTNDDLSFRIYRVENEYGGRPDNVTWDSWIGASANLVANDALVFNKELNTFAEFNIKEAVTAWYSGAPDYGLFLDGAREDAGLLFLNHDSSNSYLNQWGGMDGRPYIKVTHEKQEPIPDDYNIDDTTVTLRPFTSAEQGGLLHFQALGFDGIAQPGSVVDVEVYEVNTGKVIHTQAASSPSGFRAFPYYEPPLYPAIDKVQKYYGLSHNWQTPALLYTKDLAKNTLYGVRVRAKKLDENQKVTETGKWVESDTFQVYKATGFDHLPRILNYYGLNSAAERVILLQDNHMRDELILENNEIFVRNPKKNQGKAYVGDPLSDKDKEQIDGYLMGQGKHCEFGYEPINLNTGNFYYTNEDGQWFDYDKQFVFSRNYNSVAGGTEGMFGRNWEFSWNQHLTFREDGSAIFHDGTGKRITLDKQADGTYTAPFGEQLTLEEVKVGEKDYTYDIDYYDVVEQTPKTQTDKIGVYEYRLTSDSGMVYLFTRDGYLKQIILDRYGKTMDFTYDENQLLQKLTTPTGKELLFSYNDDGYVSEIKQPDGTSLQYTYDENGNLVTFTDAMGYTLTYEYADTANPYVMTSYLDRENNDAIIRNTYDNEGRVVKQIDAKGDTVTFAYFTDRTEITNFNGDKEYVYIDGNKRTTKKVSADGLEKIQNYDANNNLITQDLPSEEPMAFVFDGKQNKLQETRVDGKTKQYVYNNQSMPTKVTNFDGTVTTFTYDSYDNMTGVYYADGTSTETTYNAMGQKLTEKDRNGNIVTYGYDSAGNQVTETNAFGTKTKTYDALSMVTSEADAAGLMTSYIRNKRGELIEQRQPKATKVFSYDADGQKVYEKDPNGAEKRYVYDAWSRIIEEHDSYGVKKSSYDSNGNLVKSTDELGNVTTYTYDVGNRLIETRNPDGTTSTKRYDSKGRLVGTTDVLGNETITSYDDVLNKIQSTTDAIGRTTSYEYDTLGNLVKTTYPDGLVETKRYNSLNQMTESTDKTGMVTTYRYDYNGNTVETNIGGRITKTILGAADMKTNEIDVLGHQTTYTYMPTQLVDTVTMKNGMVTRYEYDNAYNITAVIDASGNRTSKTYDANNNVLTETDELGNTTTKTYTSRNQLATNAAADGGVTQYVYDAKGQQIAVIDPLGNRTETTYDAMGRTKTTKDARGFITINRYNAVGQLIETENPLGEKQAYTYTKMGLKATDTDATGKVTTYEYDSNDAIIKQSDSYGKVTENTYDAFGRLIETKNEQGHTTKTTYDAYGNKATETDIRGNTTTYTYDAENRVIETEDALGNLSKQEYTPISQKLVETEKAADYTGEQRTISTYDALARLDHTTDENGTETHFTYFDNGKVKNVTNANGAVTSYTYTATGQDATITDPNGGVTRYAYDLKGQLIKTTDPEGNTTQRVYDANGNVIREIDPLGFAIEMTYDPLNRVIEQKDKRGNITKQIYNVFGAVTETIAPNGVKTKTVYDNQGRAVKTIDGNGNVTETTYDKFSRVDKMKSANGYTIQNHYTPFNDLAKQTNNLGETLEQLLYDKVGKVIEKKDANGNITRYTYNSKGQIVDTIAENGNVISYTYDIKGRVSTMKDIRGNETVYQYSPVGEIIGIQYPGDKVFTYTYDKNGNLLSEVNSMDQETQYAYDLNNQRVSVTNALGQTMKTAYNGRGEVVEETNALGHSKSYVYDANGNKTIERDAAGFETMYHYDTANRMNVVKNRLGFETKYQFDANNNLIVTKSANDGETLFKYNEMNNLTSVINADKTTQKYTYDIKGNQTSSTTERGKTIIMKYDALNNQVFKGFDDKAYEYTYNSENQITSVVNKQEKSILTYNQFGDLTSYTDSQNNTVSYQYDEIGRRIGMTYPDGKQVDYTYNANDQLIEVKEGTDITTYEYNPVGALVKTTLPNGTVTTQTYDEGNRLVLLETLTENQVKLTSIEYTYDSRDSIIKEKSTIDGIVTTKTYEYDAEDQLIRSKHETTTEKPADVKGLLQEGSVLYEYTYDANGNKIAAIEKTNGKVTGKQFKFDAANKLLDVEGDMNTNYTYDDAGNVTKKVHKTGLIEDFKYDATGQLIQVQNNRGQTITYSYDGFGNRTSKSEKIEIESSKEDNGFLGFLKQEKYNEDYSMELDSQTTIEQLQNLKENLRDYQSTYGSSDYCPVSSEDAPKQTQKTLQYVNDINAEYTQVLQVQSDNYQPRETYVYGVQRISNEKQDQSKTFYQYDGKGSVVGQESDKKADALFFKIRYNDFGQPHRKLDNEFGYNAELHDYSRTQYLRARYYDTESGRFNQRDSALGKQQQPLSQNRYTYAWNQTNKYHDPNGHWPKWLDDAANWAGDTWNAATTWVGDTWNAVTTWVGDTWNAATTWVSDTWNAATSWVGDTWNAATSWVGDTWNAATSWVGDTWNAWQAAEAERQEAEAAYQRLIEAKETEKSEISDYLLEKGINIPNISGRSLDEQLEILRQIKQFCDEVEGKYEKWDENAIAEAMGKVNEYIASRTPTLEEYLEQNKYNKDFYDVTYDSSGNIVFNTERAMQAYYNTYYQPSNEFELIDMYDSNPEVYEKYRQGAALGINPYTGEPMTEEEIWQFNYAAITGVVTDAASSISGLWAINKSWNKRFGDSEIKYDKKLTIGDNGENRVNISAAKGTPNSSTALYDENGKLLQIRYYGSDGNATRDVDYFHKDNNGTHTFPHEHTWKDGKRI